MPLPTKDYTLPVGYKGLYVVAAWVGRHCIIPDGFLKGRQWRDYDWQLYVRLRHYQVRPEVRQNPAWLAGEDDALPVMSAAFVHRRSQVIAPQKTGKGPFSATDLCSQAVGPVLFFDWCGEEDVCPHPRELRAGCGCRGVYRCSDHGCGCGWTYAYLAGEAMGHPWPTPLIQVLASSEDQVKNIWRPLTAMANGPYLRDLMLTRGEFIRLPNEGVIEKVTSSAKSRLGNPIVYCAQDETGTFTKENGLIEVAETMRRGAAAMGGRSIETTNCYDPSEQSVAQRTRESHKADIFKFYEPPPEELKYTVARDRERIHRFNYQGSPHADLSGIDAEAAELVAVDPAQAERFYGNRMVAGLGTWISLEDWRKRIVVRPYPKQGEQVVYGFDGSDVSDWTGFRAMTQDGYQFTPTFPDGSPMIWDPSDWGGRVPRLDVAEAMKHLHTYFRVVRGYHDPPYWETEIDEWAEVYGDKVVVRWETNRPKQMFDAAERMVTDVAKSDSGFTTDDCPTTAAHVGNTRKAKRLNNRYVLTKPGDGRKIDLAVSSVLCLEAFGDVTNAKLWKKQYEVVFA